MVYRFAPGSVPFNPKILFSSFFPFYILLNNYYIVLQGKWKK
jgi:hypothetical protein